MHEVLIVIVTGSEIIGEFFGRAGRAGGVSS